MSEYDVVLQKEILREAYAGLLIDFAEFMKKNDVDSQDKMNPIVKLYWQINDIYQHILGSRYKTLEEMLEVRGQFKFFKCYIESME